MRTCLFVCVSVYVSMHERMRLIVADAHSLVEPPHCAELFK